jgi:putative aldouronate transport system permease protein
MSIKIKQNNFATKIFHIILILFSLSCIIPIITILSISLSDEMNLRKHGYSLIPAKINTDAYRFIFANPKEIFSSYGVTIAVTIIGGILSLTFISMISYALSRPDFKLKRIFSFFIFFTMIFNGGLVPTYIVVARVLHLSDTIWALIVPCMVSAWYIFMMRTFFSSIPTALFESAKIDGAIEFRIFFQIVLPLAKPALATVGLFMVLIYWNDWSQALLYISPSSENLVPLQYMLYRIMSNIQYLTQQMQSTAVTIDTSKLPNESARMAMCVLAAGPMLFVFPFFQKYFVKGLTIGAVKG